MTTHYDVIIVGAGIIGATLALKLVQNCPSLNIALIDQTTELFSQTPLPIQETVFDHRVVALNHASIALFEALDVWGDIEQQRICAYQHMSVWDQEGTGTINFSADELHQDHIGVIVEQQVLSNTLFTHLKQATTKHSLDLIDSIQITEQTYQQPHHLLSLQYSDGHIQQVTTTLLIAMPTAHNRP